MVLLTVFTPTYNRAHTLPEAYCSLKAQTSKNFLWLIVDDGSTDRTARLRRHPDADHHHLPAHLSGCDQVGRRPSLTPFPAYLRPCRM